MQNDILKYKKLKLEKTQFEFTPFQKKDIVSIGTMVKQIWTMGANKLREDKYGIIGGKSWQDWTWDSIKSSLTERNSFVTKVKGKIAGFCTFTIDETRKIGIIGYNGVSPEFSGMGIGTFQMEKILNLMRKKMMRIVEVSTGLNEGHSPARRMYEKIGFKEFSKSITYSMKL